MKELVQQAPDCPLQVLEEMSQDEEAKVRLLTGRRVLLAEELKKVQYCHRDDRLPSPCPECYRSDRSRKS